MTAISLLIFGTTQKLITIHSVKILVLDDRLMDALPLLIVNVERTFDDLVTLTNDTTVALVSFVTDAEPIRSAWCHSLATIDETVMYQ